MSDEGDVSVKTDMDKGNDKGVCDVAKSQISRAKSSSKKRY
jgi:hypothetical protein